MIFYREEERELETSMRENHRRAASCTPPTGDVPTSKVHALDRNPTWDLSVRRPMLYSLSLTGFGDVPFSSSIFFRMQGVFYGCFMPRTAGAQVLGPGETPRLAVRAVTGDTGFRSSGKEGPRRWGDGLGADEVLSLLRNS